MDSHDTPAYIISDEPEVDSPGFGFDGYAKTIADLIAYRKNRTPLVIGIYGPWGSGKTTLMKAVVKRLKGYEGKAPFRVCKPVWFQAWKYAKEEAILAALIEETFKAMQADGFFTGCKAEIEKLVATFNLKEGLRQIIKTLSAGSVDIKDLFSSLEYRKELGFFDTFQSFFDRLIWAYATGSGVQFGDHIDDSSGALVVLIDDLDRCPRPRVLQVLETVKLFMDKPGCVFVIGAAREVIESALRESYQHQNKEDAEKFMDKIVQVTFTLPKIPEQDIGTFLSTHAPDNQVLKEFTPLLARILSFNVRSVKRFLNNMNLLHSLALNAGLKLEKAPDALMRWSILEYAYPGLAKLVKENAQYVQVMREKVARLEEKGLQAGNWDVREEVVRDLEIPDPLIEFVRDRKAVDLMKGFPDKPGDIETLSSLSASTGAPETILAKEPVRGVGRTGRMAEVPKGPFPYGEDKASRNLEHDFLIDIYPVTNEQYRQFIDEGGYHKQDLWSDEGRKWKESERVGQPRLWDDPKWNTPDHPVVGVCFYEAEAFAKWAGKRLPTEEEWEKAARGVEGRIYPWGNEFDKDNCNSDQSGIGGTTPVTKYVNGRSPYGCFDMAGNVWEWTGTLYEAGKDYRVIRGGSWNYDARYLRSSNRLRFLSVVQELLYRVPVRPGRPLTLYPLSLFPVPLGFSILSRRPGGASLETQRGETPPRGVSTKNPWEEYPASCVDAPLV